MADKKRATSARHVVGSVARFAYRRLLRPLLPEVAQVKFAGIPVARRRRLGDRLFVRLGPFGTHDQPGYEETLVAALRTSVRAGDAVVVVGGGNGVTATVAAMMATSTGRVICYEGSAIGADRVRRTALVNNVSIDVRHAVVGAAIDIWEDGDVGPLVAPIDLPDCDVLQLDCEGAERVILREMTIAPRICVVETHGMFDAPTVLIRGELERIGYRVTDAGVAEPRVARFCETNDVRVLVGVLPEAGTGVRAASPRLPAG